MQWITLAVCVGGLGVAVADDGVAIGEGVGSGSGIVDTTSRLPVAGAYVRLGAHSGLKSDIARGPKSATRGHSDRGIAADATNRSREGPSSARY